MQRRRIIVVGDEILLVKGEVQTPALWVMDPAGNEFVLELTGDLRDATPEEVRRFWRELDTQIMERTIDIHVALARNGLNLLWLTWFVM